MKCACCTEERELEPSKVEDGIRGPRFCAPCIEYESQTGDALNVDLANWIAQLIVAEEYESVTNLKEKYDDGPF